MAGTHEPVLEVPEVYLKFPHCALGGGVSPLETNPMNRLILFDTFPNFEWSTAMNYLNDASEPIELDRSIWLIIS